MPERTYLSGPMTGYPEYNYPLFRTVSANLRRRGWTIESPHENPKPTQRDLDRCYCPPASAKEKGCECKDDRMWHYYMVKCREQVERCDSIILMPGWPESKGARQELEWALDLNHLVFAYDDMRGIVIRMSRYTL
jgi:hypothetical protein